MGEVFLNFEAETVDLEVLAIFWIVPDQFLGWLPCPERIGSRRMSE